MKHKLEIELTLLNEFENELADYINVLPSPYSAHFLRNDINDFRKH